MNDHEFAAYIGLDWGDQKHSVHLLVAGESKPESSLRRLAGVTHL